MGYHVIARHARLTARGQAVRDGARAYMAAYL
jgi:hypothetical protein